MATALVGFPPNAYTPRHRHPGSVTAFVLKGRLRPQLEGGPAGTFGKGRPGSSRRARCISSRRVRAQRSRPKLLAIFVAEDDCGPLTIFDR
uniref:cupin domain-containing protein n=1 Tax=Mesorhizobium silamurunense TaxID=499528 RepID=UPI0035E402BF